MYRKLTYLAALLAATSALAQGALPSPNLGANTQMNGVPLSQMFLAKSGGAMSSLLEIVPQGTTAQGAGNAGLLKLTAPYTMNAKQDTLRVAIGSCDPTTEFDSQPAGQQNYSSSGVVGCVGIPNYASMSQATWPDFGVVGIANVFNAARSAAGLGGFAGIAVDPPGGNPANGAVAEALNGVAGNAPTGLLSVDGNGHDFNSLNAVESDNQLFAKAPAAMTTATAATTASTTVIVASVTNILVGQSITGAGVLGSPVTLVTAINGTSLTLNQAATIASGAVLKFGTAPSGNVTGVSSFISGTTNLAAGVSAAFAAASQGTTVNGVPLPQWQNAYFSAAGMAANGVNLGPQKLSTTSPSQGISQTAFSATNAALTDNIGVGIDGSYNINFGAGSNPTLNMAGVSVLKATGGTNQVLDQSGNAGISVSTSQVTMSKALALPALPVASLPACNTATRDAILIVSDATAPTYRGALTGGGTVRTLVECDGTSWTSH